MNNKGTSTSAFPTHFVFLF